MCRRTHARRKLRHDATKLTKLAQEEKLKVLHACARRKLRHDATKLTKLTQEEKLKVPHA